jgi:carbon-monoxide dehydrogenase large subunit
MTTYVGQGVKRTEDPPLITGEGRYVDDMRVPGILHAAFLRSLHAHARIKAIDVSAALRMKGVITVVTSDDLVGVMDDPRLDPIPPNVRMTEIRQPILARGKARYVGEPVAMVVAEDRYLAQDALEQIRVEYEPLPSVIELADALKDEVILHDDPGTNVVLRIDEKSGDVEEAFKAADRVIKRNYSVNRVCAAHGN